MSSSPEHQAPVPATVQSSSPQVSRSDVVMSFPLTSDQPHLPSDLLDSSPEMESVGQTGNVIADTGVEPATTTELVTAADTAAHTVEHVTTRSHHDWIMAREEEVLDAIWGSLERESLPPRPDNTPARAPTPTRASTPLGEPGPAQPTSPHQQPHRPNFQPPGHLRTPQQRAIVDQMTAAVAARAREQQEADRARQAQLTGTAERTANDGADVGSQGQGRWSGQEGRRIYDWPRYTYGQQVNVMQGGTPAIARNPNDAPNQMPPLPDQQDLAQPFQPSPFPALPNTSGFQQVPTQESQHQGDSIFNQLMNQLIANSRAEPGVGYRQVRLPAGGSTPYGMEYLYYGAYIGDDHWLRSRAVERCSTLREIRNARNGELVGWQDSMSRRPAGVHLFPTQNPGRWNPAGSQAGGPSGGHRGQ